jgi:hypothetical protein
MRRRSPRDDHGAAFRRKREGDRFADPSAAAGDDGRLPFEREFHLVL